MCSCRSKVSRLNYSFIPSQYSCIHNVKLIEENDNTKTTMHISNLFRQLYFSDQRALFERFNYLHNVIKIPHDIILKYPNSLLCRSFKVKQRHQFLCQLGRAQYDPQKENYIPIMALVEDTDVNFCNKYAKCNIENFNTFLKTL